MAHVARAVGVAPATVSRVFTGNAVVAEETRERILKTSQQLGYRPNHVARSLAQRRTRTLGLVMNSRMAFPSVMRGAEAMAMERGYSVITTLPNRQPAVECQRVEILLDRQVDGILMVSTSDARDHAVLEALQRDGVPVVTVNRYWEGGKGWRVFFDHLGAERAVVRRLIAAGHRRIGFVGGLLDDPVLAVRERIAGYREALQEAGLWTPEAEAFGDEPGTRWAKLGERLTGGLLKRCPDVTAVVAFTDEVAAGALRALHRCDRAVPEQVAVVGFDDTPVARSTDPALSSVRLPEQEAGREACRLLVEQVEAGADEGGTVVLPASLVVRESCGLGDDSQEQCLLPLN